MFAEDFAGRCLPFDEVAAAGFGEIAASRMRAGHPLSVEGAQIAAIARAAGFSLATRNTADFARIDGLPLINPWLDQ